MADAPPVGVLVPVKAFTQAKLRLAAVLEAPERAALARSMAATVVRAARDLPVWVVCDDDEVADWAPTVGAHVLWSPGKGLNGAVTDGVDALADRGVTRVVVAHADLPLATDLTWLGAWADSDPGVMIVPDERDDGTNVIALPAASGFRFHYGPSSFRRHQEEAWRRGLEFRVARDAALAFDVDTPADLDRLDRLPLQPAEPAPRA
jgi:2-phospho-L-lactate guanylyltransferase